MRIVPAAGAPRRPGRRPAPCSPVVQHDLATGRLCTISRQMARPRPEPLRGSPAAKGWNRRWRWSAPCPGRCRPPAARPAPVGHQHDGQRPAGRGVLDGVVQQVAHQLAQRPFVARTGAGPARWSKSSWRSAISGARSSATARTHRSQSTTGPSPCWRSCSTLASASIWLASSVARSTVVRSRPAPAAGRHRRGAPTAPGSSAPPAVCAAGATRRARSASGGPAARPGAPSRCWWPRHGLQFARRVGGGQRRQVVLGGARRSWSLSSRTGRVARCTTTPPRRRSRHQQRLLPQRVGQQLARQRAPQLQRFGHLDGGHALAGLAGHRLQQHGHAHRLAAHGSS
jgi:hypothetical protein